MLLKITCKLSTLLLEKENTEEEKPSFIPFYDGYDIACIVDAIVKRIRSNLGKS